MTNVLVQIVLYILVALGMCWLLAVIWRVALPGILVILGLVFYTPFMPDDDEFLRGWYALIGLIVMFCGMAAHSDLVTDIGAGLFILNVVMAGFWTLVNHRKHRMY
jgi:hypothetical protein